MFQSIFKSHGGISPLKTILNMAVVFSFIMVSPFNATAYRIELTSHEGISGGSWAEITGGGTKEITFDIGLAVATIADIRAFLFNIDGNESISNITVNSLTDVNDDFTTVNVITNWPNLNFSMNGGGIPSFNYGIEFGGNGIGNNKGDIRTINFTIFGTSAFELGNNFGMLLTSFGDDREDSRKMIGSSIPVPEPTTMLLFGTGLIGLAAGFRRKFYKCR